MGASRLGRRERGEKRTEDMIGKIKIKGKGKGKFPV